MTLDPRKILVVTVPRRIRFEKRYNPAVGRMYDHGIPVGTVLHVSKNDRYVFGGKRYRILFCNRGAFGDHHWQESLVEPWGAVTFYDDLKGGYNVPIEDFTSDEKIARIWLVQVE